MGACASMVKGMKAEYGTVPPPEPVKEENSEVTEVKGSEEVKVEQEDEKKVEDVGNHQKEEVKEVDENIKKNGENVDDDNKHSLGALLNESEEVKKESREDVKTASEQEPKTVEKVEGAEKSSIVAGGPQEVGKPADKVTTEVKEE